MTGAIEFLRKAKAICEIRGCIGVKDKCPAYNLCHTSAGKITDEADLVRKVMDYRLEDVDA
ncbi:hypothetical protein I5677_12225 [Mobilitalea sibirica]|uniref:Uncharacterized protein n=1 Tax=Mobilitalea sibirica TaxID=1462919 RepID=A0A8J7HAX9_9FIRM|nr:hypothetical protein [Mobilitalea sibirica]MBH1941660.1 hypothetical protein [Mobilitalea sibirica]